MTTEPLLRRGSGSSALKHGLKPPTNSASRRRLSDRALSPLGSLLGLTQVDAIRDGNEDQQWQGWQDGGRRAVGRAGDQAGEGRSEQVSVSDCFDSSDRTPEPRTVLTKKNTAAMSAKAIGGEDCIVAAKGPCATPKQTPIVIATFARLNPIWAAVRRVSIRKIDSISAALQPMTSVSANQKRETPTRMNKKLSE